MELKIEINEERLAAEAARKISEEIIRRTVGNNYNSAIKGGMDKALQKYIEENEEEIKEKVIERATKRVVKKVLGHEILNAALQKILKEDEDAKSI